MSKPLITRDLNWKGTIYHQEFFDNHDFSELEEVTQVQAVPFVGDQVVLLKHIDGYYSLPGGHIEAGEDIETALRRELVEEVSTTIAAFGAIGFVRVTRPDKPDFIEHQLRYWAEVELLDWTPDPDGKATDRVLMPIGQAPETLDWGEFGEAFIKLAAENKQP